jgi:hypothetical protein
MKQVLEKLANQLDRFLLFKWKSYILRMFFDENNAETHKEMQK